MDIDYGRIRTLIYDWDRRLQPFRDYARERTRKYVGYRYSTNGFNVPQPMNLVALQVNIISNHLVSSTPQAILRARAKSLNSYAKTYEASVNSRYRKMRLGNTLNTAARDAMFSGIGMLKIGWSDSPFQPGTGKLGGIFAENVHIDDLILDMYAKRWDDLQCIGNRYMLPTEFVRQRFDAPNAVPDMGRPITMFGSERTREIAAGNRVLNLNAIDMTNMIDLWFPFHGKICTLLDNGSVDPIHEEVYRGPVHGPYRGLAFLEVSGNLIPISPVALTEDLADTINVVSNKVSDQAFNQKTLVLAQLAATKDAEAVKNAKDGEIVPVQHTNGITTARFGGPDQANIGFALQWRNMFMEMAGNLQTLGGLSSQADTLGQERLLSLSANKLVSGMQEKMIEFTSDVMKDISLLHWMDRQQEEIVTRQIGKSTITDTFGKMNPMTGMTDHLGDWDDYQIEVEPYSMNKKSPAERMAAVDQFMQTTLLPAAPLMAQQGIQINWSAYVDLKRRYGDMTELDELLIRTDPAGAQQEVSSPDSAFSHRVYERRNIPGATVDQQNQVASELMFGQNPQGSEAATLSRAAG